MGIGSVHKAPNGLIEQYLGTAYDTVRKVADQIESVKSVADVIDDDIDFATLAQVLQTLGDSVSDLAALATADLVAITDDLGKGNYLGNRKIDINLALNNNSPDTEVTYKGITLTTNSGAVVNIDFTTTDDQGNKTVQELASYTAIYNALVDGIGDYNAAESDAQKHIVNTEIDIINSTLPNLPTMIRIRDTDGSASSIDRIQLHVYSGSAKDLLPTYFWAKTTSALQTLSNRVGDVIALGNDIDSIIALASQTDEIEYLYADRDKLTGASDSIHSELSKLKALHADLSQLLLVSSNLGSVNQVAGGLPEVNTVSADIGKVVTVSDNISAVVNVSTHIGAINDVRDELTALNGISVNLSQILASEGHAGTASSKAGEASSSAQASANSAVAAANQAQLATDKSNEIKAITVGSTTTGVAGSEAVVTFNSATGKFAFVIPQGQKGEKGDAFQVNSVGLLSEKSLHDDKQKGFSFLATDANLIFFKVSSTSGDWSTGAPFGKGDKGDTGDTGNGIVSIGFTSSTGGGNSPGQAGETDTYTIQYTNGSDDTFTVYNGKDVQIDDATVSAASVWSSSKINQELGNKANSSQVLTDVPENAKFTDTVYVHPPTHAINEISGLQGALNGKVSTSQVLTPVPENAKFTDTVYEHPSSHSLSEISNAGTAASKDVPASGDAGSEQVVLGGDTRLTDPRDPKNHNHDLNDLPSDLITKTAADGLYQAKGSGINRFDKKYFGGY